MKYNRLFKLKNKIQEYDWGSKMAIPSLLGLPVPSTRPMAEMWMGAHPRAPSEIEIDGEWRRLDQVIANTPVPILGKGVADKFLNELPFLFKVIAAAKPLSVQAHPNKAQAIAGFERENRLQIPLDAPERNYKDKNHKPEILCALTRFEALKGFRDINQIISLMERAVPLSLGNELEFLRKNKDLNGLSRFYASIMKMDTEKREASIGELLRNAKKYLGCDPAYSLVIKLNEFFPMDIGIFSPLLLNRVVLNPGEAIYLPAGELHAYIEGFGVELMANSDNVLRGGLTHKHVDTDELLNILSFNYGPAHIIAPEVTRQSEAIYPAPAEEFALSVITVDDKSSFISSEDRPVEIMIFIEGEAEIEDLQSNDKVRLKKGDSVLIPSLMPQYEICGNATIYKASVPI